MNPAAAAGFGMNFMDGLSSLGSGISQSLAQRAQGEYLARMLRLNAKFADFQAKEAIRRGEISAGDYQKKVAQLMGTQHVALASQGVQLGEGSAAEIQADTADQAARDVVTIRGNAWREAWGHRVQAQDLRGQAKYALIASDFEADMALLGGLSKAGSSFGRAGSYLASGAKSAKQDAGRAAAEDYFSGTSPDYFRGITPPGMNPGDQYLSNSGSGPGRWGRTKDGSWGYGYRSMWDE